MAAAAEAPTHRSALLRAAGLLAVAVWSQTLCASSAAASPALSAPADDDRITRLPGIDVSALPFSMWSGYINVNASNGRNLFYWLCESQWNPSTDPLLVWLQGGPGCSGEIAMLTENGPLQPTLLSDGSVGLEVNPLSWNRFANVLYVDAPAGVGFSFSKNPSDYNTNNLKTAQDNYAFLQGFLAKFPQFASNPLWISGESYGGDYVPQLVTQIVNGSDPRLKSMLRGFIVGNPVFSCDAWKREANNIQVNLFYWHGLVPLSSYMGWHAAGCGGAVGSAPSAPPSVCDKLLADMTSMIGDFDPDNLYTNPFTGNASLGIGPTPAVSVQSLRDAYLNAPDVQNALHARPTNWSACCAEEGQSGAPCQLNYTNNWDNMLPTYRYFFEQRPDLAILIYSGDVDIATCPFAYAQLCLADLNRPLLFSWQPWIVEGQTAGYREIYDRFTYATVKGAGHEVPTFQPLSSYHLVSKFISGQF